MATPAPQTTSTKHVTTTTNREVTIDMQRELEQSKTAMANMQRKLKATLDKNKELGDDLTAARTTIAKAAGELALEHDVSETRLLFTIQELLNQAKSGINVSHDSNDGVDVTLITREKDALRAENEALRVQLREAKSEAEERLIASFVEAESAHQDVRVQHDMDREQAIKEIYRLAEQMEKLRASANTAASERDEARRAQLEAEKRADTHQQEVYEVKMAMAECKGEAKKATDLTAGLELQLREAHNALEKAMEELQILREDRAADKKVKDSEVMESRIRLDEFKATRQKELENMRVALEDEREKLLKELEMRHEAESRMADLDVLVDQLRSDKARLMKELDLMNQFRQNRDAMYKDVESRKGDWDSMNQRIAAADEQSAQALAQVEMIEIEKQTLELALQKSMHEREQLARLIVAIEPQQTISPHPSIIPATNRL